MEGEKSEKERKGMSLLQERRKKKDVKLTRIEEDITSLN